MRALQCFYLFFLAFILGVSAQVKIGSNPQNINPFSILELESNASALVITRMSTAQMNGITPLQGALVYNSDEQCVFYYNGALWENLCSDDNTTNISLELQESELILTDSDGNTVAVELGSAIDQTFSSDPIVGFRETIIITQTGDNYNFEVGEITGDNIVDSSINGIDLQDNSITDNKLAPNSVGQEELQDNAVSDLEIDYSQVTLSDFNNDAGFLTISPEPNNAIIDNNGAFYDDTIVQTGVATNAQGLADHIAADGDLDNQNELVLAGSVTGNTLTLNQAGGNPPVNIDITALNNSGTDEQNLNTDNTPGNISIDNGNAITLNVNDGDFDDQNEIQDANEVDINPITGITGGNVQLALEELQADVDNLAAGGGNTDEQDLGIGGAGTPGQSVEVTITNGNNAIVDIRDGDSNSTNEIQDADEVTIDPITGIAGGNVQLALQELQTDVDNLVAGGGADGVVSNVGFDGTNLNFTGANGGFNGAVDISALAGGDDGVVSNVQLTGTDLIFTGANGGFNNTVSLATLANTDAQNLSLAGNTLNISGGTGVDLTPVIGGADTNDFVNGGTLNVESLELTGTGGAGTTVDLSAFALDTDLTGFLTVEADGDPNNEIELPDDSAATAGDVLVTQGGGIYTWATITGGVGVDTNDFVNGGTLNVESLELTGTGGAGTTVDLSAFALDTDLTGFLTVEADGDPNNEIELPDDSAATAGDILATDGAGNYSWVGQAAADGNDFVNGGTLNVESLELTGTGGAGTTVDLSAFALDTDLTGFLTVEADGDPNNEIELPDDSAATAGDVLATDGAGNYSWVGQAAADGNDFVNGGTLNVESLELTGTGGAGTTVDLSAFALDTDLTGFLTVEADGDPNNEIELPDDSAATAGDILATDGAGNYSWVGQAAADGNDFVNGGTLNVESLELTGTGGAGTTVDLSAFALDTDLTGFLTVEADGDPNNEIELPDDSAATAGDVLATDGAGNYSWVGQAAADGNDFVNGGTLNVESLELTGTGGAGTTVDLSAFALDTDLTGFLTVEADGDPNNEIELPDDSAATAGDILATDGAGNYSWVGQAAADGNDFVNGGTLNVESLELTGTGGAGTTVDLSAFALDTDLTGFLTVEADGDPNNEIELPDDSAATAGDVLATDGAGNYSWVGQAAADGNDFVNGGTLNVESLELTGTGGAGTTVDLSAFALDTDLASITNTNFAEDDLTLNGNRTHELNGNNLIFDGTGNVGIGNLPGNPQSKLDVDGQIQARNGFASSQGSESLPAYSFSTGNDNDTGMYRAGANQIGFVTNASEALRIDNSQNIGIGTTTIAANTKLHIVGNSLFDGDVTITTGNTFTPPDYVFEKYFEDSSILKPNYRFLPLDEVEKFTQKFKHLPGIPSARDMQKNGILLNKTLFNHLEKIEELFLHTIEQEKKIESLKEENAHLTNELDALKKDMALIKELLATKKEP